MPPQEHSCVENDVCSSAAIVSSLPYSSSGDTLLATTEGSVGLECGLVENHFEWSGKDWLYDSRGLWFSIDGGLAECFNATLVRSDAPTVVAAYTGTCSKLSCVSSGEGSATWISGGSGVDYKLLVVGQEGNFGSFQLDVTVRGARIHQGFQYKDSPRPLSSLICFCPQEC